MNRRDFIPLSGMAAWSGLTPAWPVTAAAAETEAPGVAPVDRDRHIRQYIPDFLDDYVRQMTFSLSFADQNFPDFNAWKREARAKSFELIGYDPPAVDFAPEVLREEDRGVYVQQKITFAASPWYRVPAYLLIPRGTGPFPAIVNLHDHGAFFLYGKEKLVATEADHNPGLRAFKETSYAGRSTAHELAQRGYVVLVIDALFWGERAPRGCGEERFDLNSREGVQAWNAAAYQTAGPTSANLLNAGLSWCSVLLRDDLQSVEFLASRPFVDSRRIGSCGLSVGCFRSWHLAALSDLIQASANICWMTQIQTQLLERCNLSTSIGAMSMVIPGIMRYLDYPDLASLVCPKPALFFNGRRDGLFPVSSVERAFAKMRKVWDSQGVGDRLYLRLWDVPHEFNVEMQEEAFAWLDRWLQV